MLLFDCPKCGQSFFVEDSRISDVPARFCPNCDNPVPPVVLRVARSIAQLASIADAQGWEVSHLVDKRFKVEVALKER